MKVASCENAAMETIELKLSNCSIFVYNFNGLIGHQAQKRKDVQLETDSSVSLLPLKRSKSKLLSNYYNDNLGCKFSLKRDGPKWNPERIKAHTQFIMGSRANKVLGYGQTRGRLYVRHPNLLRYCGDQEDKEWLQSQNLLPANGGKIYIMLLQDIQELTESDEYCNNPNLQLQELQGFEAPMFMCDKIRNFLEYIKNEKKLMAVLDVDENSSEITTVLPDTDERSEKNVWRTSQLRQQIDYPNMSSDMSTLSSSVISISKCIIPGGKPLMIKLVFLCTLLWGGWGPVHRTSQRQEIIVIVIPCLWDQLYRSNDHYIDNQGFLVLPPNNALDNHHAETTWYSVLLSSSPQAELEVRFPKCPGKALIKLPSIMWGPISLLPMIPHHTLTVQKYWHSAWYLWKPKRIFCAPVMHY
ncbi:hypothetical protein YQE_04670, partial [Dendroctonus ponderosae]